MPKQGQYVPAMFLNQCVGGVLCGLLWLYQAGVSPFMGAQCRHLPTCSQYAKDTLDAWPFARIVVCSKTYLALSSMGNAHF